MLDRTKLLTMFTPPSEDRLEWMQKAEESTNFLFSNSRSDEIILFASLSHGLVHAVFADQKSIYPPDRQDIIRGFIFPDATWGIEYTLGGGTSDEIYLSEPLSSPGCNSLAGGEKIVFRRYFDGVQTGPSIPEMNQRLIHSLDLYWVEEKQAFCELDEHGDIEPIIRFIPITEDTGSDNDCLITIKAKNLYKYMAVNNYALVQKFDFTRVEYGSFPGWNNQKTSYEEPNPSLFFNTGKQAGASYANGACLMMSPLSKIEILKELRDDWSDTNKSYATFKAFDWKNKVQAEISCSPDALASYFDKESERPFQITPAFFRSEVLHKYKADPEKYDLENRSVGSRAGWNLKTYDVNEAGQVHTYLCYLADLPYSEQLYWQSFNEWPKGPISERAYKTDIEGDWDVQFDALMEIKSFVTDLDSNEPIWWSSRGESLRKAVHHPVTDSIEEWANAILTLDQLVVEGFSTKGLRSILKRLECTFEKQWQSMKLTQTLLEVGGRSESDAKQVVEPLKALHQLRSKVKGHAGGSEKNELVKTARKDFGNLSNHFNYICAECFDSLSKISGDFKNY